MVAFHQDLEISIVYYEDGYTKSTWGKIKKIDALNQVIILNPFDRIKATDIIEITL